MHPTKTCDASNRPRVLIAASDSSWIPGIARTWRSKLSQCPGTPLPCRALLPGGVQIEQSPLRLAGHLNCLTRRLSNGAIVLSGRGRFSACGPHAGQRQSQGRQNLYIAGSGRGPSGLTQDHRNANSAFPGRLALTKSKRRLPADRGKTAPFKTCSVSLSNGLGGSRSVRTSASCRAECSAGQQPDY